MKAKVDAIKARGYWQTTLRPASYRPDRIRDKLAVVDFLSGILVNLRGWSFPHVDRQTDPIVEPEWVGQITELRYFHECWRMTVSGQFYHVAGMRHDWGAQVQASPFTDIEEGQKILGVGDSLFRFTEMIAFASRYGTGVAKAEGLDVELEAGGLEDRQLIVDDPGRGGFGSYRSHSRSPFRKIFRLSDGTPPDELRALARQSAAELFELFGCRLANEVLEDWQSKIGRW